MKFKRTINAIEVGSSISIFHQAIIQGLGIDPPSVLVEESMNMAGDFALLMSMGRTKSTALKVGQDVRALYDEVRLGMEKNSPPDPQLLTEAAKIAGELALENVREGLLKTKVRDAQAIGQVMREIYDGIKHGMGEEAPAELLSEAARIAGKFAASPKLHIQGGGQDI